MRGRTLTLTAVIVAVCGTAAFVFLRGGGDDETAASSAAPRVEPPHAGSGRVDTPRPALGVTTKVTARDQVANVSAPADPDEAKNAPVDPTPPTHEEPLTADEQNPRMTRAVQMLDEAIARSEARLSEAETAGDAAAATTARVRIAKLKEVRDLRARELEAKP